MKKQRTHFSLEQRQKLLREFQRSNLTVTDFARQNGLSRPLLSVWLRRYVRPARVGDAPSGASAQIPMQEIELGPWASSGWAAEVVLPNGLRLRLDGVGRAQLLEQLLRLC